MLAVDASVYQGYERHSPLGSDDVSRGCLCTLRHSPTQIYSLKRCWVGMMLAMDACVHQDFERHRPPSIFYIKRCQVCWVGMMLAGDACVHQGYKRHAQLT